MVTLRLIIIYYISFNIILAQHDSNNNCENHMLNISSKCTVNNNYYSPTIAIQTLKGYNRNNLFESYSQLSLLINANHDVIITPHCVSIEITVNPTILNYLTHQWLLNKVDWPSDHQQGEIITFTNTQKHSTNIIFKQPCILSPNNTNVLILLFNTNFNTYNISIQNTINCGRINGITIYDKLYNYNSNTNNIDNNNCFPMQSDARLNLYMPKNGTTERYSIDNVVIKTHKNESSTNGLVVALIVIIILVNIGSCALLWYFNHKQLSKSIKQISENIKDITITDLNINKNKNKHQKIKMMKDNTTTVISSVTETKAISQKNENNNNVLPLNGGMTNTTANTSNNTNNTIIWVNKSYFDSNHMDDFNLYSGKHNMHSRNLSLSDTTNTTLTDDNIEDGIIANELMSGQNKLNKLRILLPHNYNTNSFLGSPTNGTGNDLNTNTNTTLTAITLSDCNDCDWKTPSTINTLNNTPNGINNLCQTKYNNLYIMDEIINENEETPIGMNKPNLMQIGFRSNESNKSTISVTSSIRLPAYHPNKIKIMNDNKHIPYNKQFIIAVTPPFNKPTLFNNKIGYNSNNSNNSLALPNTNTNNLNQTCTNIHK